MAGAGEWRPDKPKLDRIFALIRDATSPGKAGEEHKQAAAVSRLRELSEQTPDAGLYALLVLRSPPAPNAESADQMACSMVQAAIRRSARDRASVLPELVRRAKLVCLQESVVKPTRPHGPRAMQSLAATVALLARSGGVNTWPEAVHACRNGLKPTAPPGLRQLSASLASMLLEDASAAAAGEQQSYGAASAAPGRKSRWGPSVGEQQSEGGLEAALPRLATAMPTLDTTGLDGPVGAVPGFDKLLEPPGREFNLGPSLSPSLGSGPAAGDGSFSGDEYVSAVERGRLAVQSLGPLALDLARWAEAGCQALKTKGSSAGAGAPVSLPTGVSADEAIAMLPVALEAIKKCPHAVVSSPELREHIVKMVGGLALCLRAAASAAKSGFSASGPRSSQGNQVLSAGVHAAGLLKEVVHDHGRQMWPSIGHIWDGVVAALQQNKCVQLQKAVIEIWLEVWVTARSGFGGDEVRAQTQAMAGRLSPLLVPLCMLHEEDEAGGHLPTTDVADARVPDTLADLHPSWKHRLEETSEGGATGGSFMGGGDAAMQDVDDGLSIDAAAACGASTESGGLMWTLRRSAALGLEAAAYAGMKDALAPIMPIIAKGAAQMENWKRREACVLCAGIVAPPLGKAQGYSPAVDGLLKRVLHLLRHDAQPLVRRAAAWAVARVATSTLATAASDARFEANAAALEAARDGSAARGMSSFATAATAAVPESRRSTQIRQAVDACFRGLIQAMGDRNKLVQRGVIASLQSCLQQVSSESSESVLVPALITGIQKGLASYQLRSYLATCRLGTVMCLVYGRGDRMREVGRAWLPELLRRWGLLSRSNASVGASSQLQSGPLRAAYAKVLGPGGPPGAAMPVPSAQQVARYALMSTMAAVVEACGDSAAPVAPQLSALACLAAHDELSRYERAMEQGRSNGLARVPFPAEDYVRSALRLLSSCARAANDGAGSPPGSGAFLPAVDQPDVFRLLPRTLSHASASIRTAAFRLASSLMSSCAARTLGSARGITKSLVAAMRATAGSSEVAMATSAVATACKLLRVARRDDRTLAQEVAGELAPPLLANVKSGGLLQSQPILLQAQAEAIAWCCVCAPARTAASMRPETLGLVALHGTGMQALSLSSSETPAGELREVTARGCMAAVTANERLLQPQVGPSLAMLVYMCHQQVPRANSPGVLEPPTSGCIEAANALLRRLKAAASGMDGLKRLLARMPEDQRDFLLKLAAPM